MLVIVDYGVGNISSIRNMLEKVGCEHISISGEAEAIEQASKLVIPGVGAFDHGMSCLDGGQRLAALNEAVLERRVPVLGICLGMQLMCSRSEEGAIPGLGWIDAEVRRFNLEPSSNLKVPHMGWNTLAVHQQNPLIPADDGEQRFYFVHSYHAVCRHRSDVCATARHGYEFDAAFAHENIFGVQFHPEKSHRFGMALMKRFAEL